MKHAGWCGRGHYCARGEHRSEPHILNTDPGVLILTHVATDRGEHVEIRSSTPFPIGRDPHVFLQQLAYAVDLAIRTAAAGNPQALPTFTRVEITR